MISPRWAAAGLAAALLSGCAAQQAGSSARATAQPDVAAPSVAVETLLSLEGLAETAVAAALGPADRRRTEGPAVILQFMPEDCVLDLFLYPDEDDDTLRVTHAEARDRLGAAADGRLCIAAIADRKAQAS